MIIPTIGRVRLLRRCLASVLACDPAPAEVVLVDQSGDNEVQDLLDDLGGARIRRIADPAGGIGRALNLGIRYARQPTILVTHDDCTVRADWVQTAARLLAKRPELLVTGRVEPGTEGRHVPSCKTDRVPEDHSGGFRYDLLYCNNWGASREAILKLGGFDERQGLRLAAEDCDFCFRWTTQGRPVRYEPGMVVWHHDWRSEPALRRTYRAYGRGLGAFYAKHLLAGHWELTRYLARDFARGAKRSARGRVRREPPGHDADRGLLLGLPLGLALGAAEELRLRQAGSSPQRRPPFASTKPPSTTVPP